MATTNELGFGSLASVAWTDMNGTGLKSGTSELAAVDTAISAASTIASVLIDVIKRSVKAGQTSFKLESNADIATYLPLTNLNAGNETVGDWAAFIGKVTGENLPVGKELSLNQWRAVAAQLQDHASQQASRIDPYRTEENKPSGGIKTVNGHWYVNGQQLSLLDAYMAIRVNQVANFDDSLNVYIAELNANNRLVKAANDWLSTLRNNKPTDTTTSSTITHSPGMRATFSAKWGYDPYLVFQPKATTTSGNYKVWDTYIDDVKSYIDAKDTSNQTVQQKLEQMTNRRSEVLEGLTSFAKAQTQTGSSFARNLG